MRKLLDKCYDIIVLLQLSFCVIYSANHTPIFSVADPLSFMYQKDCKRVASIVSKRKYLDNKRQANMA